MKKQSNGRLLVLAVSEGGPPVIHAVLSQLTTSFPVSIAVYQIFQSGAIDPLCNALNRTTQLTVKPVDTVETLSPGVACVIPFGLGAVIEEASSQDEPRIRLIAGAARNEHPFVRFVTSACRFYGMHIKLALAGGSGAAAESILHAIEVVRGYGGDVAFVREPDDSVTPELKADAREGIRIEALSVDDLVSGLYSWCGLTEKARHPT